MPSASPFASDVIAPFIPQTFEPSYNTLLLYLHFHRINVPEVASGIRRHRTALATRNS